MKIKQQSLYKNHNVIAHTHWTHWSQEGQSPSVQKGKLSLLASPHNVYKLVLL